MSKLESLLAHLEADGSPYRVLGYNIPRSTVERILAMPRIGKRLSYTEAREIQISECFSGGAVDFTPAAQDIVQWAIDRGYFIEFAENELEF